MLTSLEICIFARKLVNYMCTNRLKTAFVALSCVCVSLYLSSWDSDSQSVIGPIPPSPHYDDPSQWFIVNRQGEADLFYIISTETGDHMIGSDTCHFADTYNAGQRGQMRIEMHAVDSFYSGKLNYYSPYYRQVSLQSWSSTETALARLPLAMSDCVRSWDYYIKHLNQGRPFILAGFSQGAHAMLEIMKRMPDDVADRMVAAYFIGYRITKEDTACCRHLHPACKANDTKVSICFNSVKTPECEIPVVSAGNLFCINPINWRTDTVGASFVYYDKEHQNDTLSARLDPKSKLLLIGGYKNDEPMPVIGIPGNYHHMELRFYYPYIRQNMADRVEAFINNKN